MRSYFLLRLTAHIRANAGANVTPATPIAIKRSIALVPSVPMAARASCTFRLISDHVLALAVVFSIHLCWGHSCKVYYSQNMRKRRGALGIPGIA